MARPSLRAARRHELALALERALAAHGVGGATTAAVAAEAGVAPGLLHHHFADRDDLYEELLRVLAARFRADLAAGPPTLSAWIHVALAPRGPTASTEARAWVGLFAEAIRHRPLATLLRRALTGELDRLERLLAAEGHPHPRDHAAGLVALLVGALVLGALVPGRAPGFAARCASHLAAPPAR